MTDYLKSIINAFQDLIFIFDQNGIIVDYLTPNHRNHLIAPPEAFINKNYNDVLPPDVSREISKAISKIDKGTESVQFDYRLDLEGDTHWFSAVLSRIEHEKSARYLGVVRNITKRIRSEKALEESEKKYRAIFENVRDVFYQTDKEGIITEISPSIERYSGYTREEVIGENVLDFYFNPTDRAQLIEKLNQKGEVIDFEVRLKTKTDQLAYASVNAHLIFDKDGSISGIEGHMRDISERKKAENELLETNKKLRKLNSQKDKLFSVIAHDLRNSITGSTGIFEFLSDGPDSFTKEELFEYLKHFEKSLSHSTLLLENLLMWARNQFRNVSINPEAGKLRNIVDVIIDLVEIQASEKQINIHNEVPDNMSVYADPDMLMTILRNLLTNAIKFSNSEGIVVISAKETENDVRISVKDYGVGMNHETLEKIFDKEIHYSSKGTNNEKGSGLGLDLCIDFVEKHNGTITATSNPGEGSTFVFNLPKKGNY